MSSSYYDTCHFFYFDFLIFLIKKNPRVKLISYHVSQLDFYIQFGSIIRYLFSIWSYFLKKKLTFLFLSKLRQNLICIY